jgi:hypothetical protein
MEITEFRKNLDFDQILVSFELHIIDLKFNEDHEKFIYFADSSVVKALSLTSGILPENLHKTNK